MSTYLFSKAFDCNDGWLENTKAKDNVATAVCCCVISSCIVVHFLVAADIAVMRHCSTHLSKLL